MSYQRPTVETMVSSPSHTIKYGHDRTSATILEVFQR